jgi:hypothetical protein
MNYVFCAGLAMGVIVLLVWILDSRLLRVVKAVHGGCCGRRSVAWVGMKTLRGCVVGVVQLGGVWEGLGDGDDLGGDAANCSWQFIPFRGTVHSYSSFHFPGKPT